MQNLEQNLTQYAAYHRDKRNIATHFVGVPMIVFAVVLSLAVVSIPVGPIGVTLAAILSIAASAYYLRLDLGLGVTMAITLFLMQILLLVWIEFKHLSSCSQSFDHRLIVQPGVSHGHDFIHCDETIPVEIGRERFAGLLG